MSALAELIESVRNLPPTEYELLQIRICDALLQYDGGKWASTVQERIPMSIVRAALAAYDPAQPLRFHSQQSGMRREAAKRRSAGPKPPCPGCGSTRLRSHGWNKARTEPRWMCYGCGKFFSQETKEAIAC